MMSAQVNINIQASLKMSLFRLKRPQRCLILSQLIVLEATLLMFQLHHVHSLALENTPVVFQDRDQIQDQGQDARRVAALVVKSNKA